MSFTVVAIRPGPVRLASRLPQLVERAAPRIRGHALFTARAFHRPTTKSSLLSPRTALLTSPAPLLRAGSNPANAAISRIAGASRNRSYYQQAQTQTAPDRSSLLRKLFIGGAIFGGTLIAVNVVFNRETRDDGGMPPYEREYLNSSFLHTGLGIGIIALTARQMIQSGFVYRIMVTHPMIVAIGGLGLSFATMIGTRSISPDK